MKSLTRAVVCICVLFSFPGVGTGAPFAYITNTKSNSVSVIDTATNTVIATVAVGSFPYGVAVHPDGSRVYVVNAGSNTVSVINTATNTVVGTVQVGTAPAAFGQFIGPAACSATQPFHWPTLFSASQVSQDYAEFNSPGTQRPDHYHTGMDLASPTYGVSQQVFAVAKGEVVAVCPNGVAGGCVFDGTVFSTNASNHGFQGEW